MNYAQYLQSGGELELPQVEARLGRKEVQQLVANIINGDEESARILVENAIKDPENSDIAEVLTGAQEAAQQGNEQAVKFMSIVGPLLEQAQQAQSMKCGGKVRAKMKAGKKMEKGGEASIKKEAKGGKQPCPCTLHRVGGKLIEVDCNGVPVLKAAGGDKLPPAQASPAVKAYMTAKPISTAMPFSDQWFGDLGNTFVKKMNTWQTGLQKKNPSFWGSPTQPATPAPQPAASQPAIGSEEWKAQQRANQEAYNKSPEGQEAIRKADEAIAARKAAQPAPVQPVQSKYQGLFSGDLRSLDARKKWVADNADYLKAQGWTDDDIAGYRGQADLNMRLSGHINGADAWYAQQAQALREANSGLQRISVPVIAPAKITPSTMTAGNPNQLALDKTRNIVNLNTITPGQALSLDAEGWNRYMNTVFKKSGGKLNYANYINK